MSEGHTRHHCQHCDDDPESLWGCPAEYPRQRSAEARHRLPDSLVYCPRHGPVEQTNWCPCLVTPMPEGWAPDAELDGWEDDDDAMAVEFPSTAPSTNDLPNQPGRTRTQPDDGARSPEQSHSSG